MILLYNLRYKTLSLALPPVQYQAQEPKLQIIRNGAKLSL